MAGKFISKIIQGAFIGLSGYEIGSKNIENQKEIKVIQVTTPPVQEIENSFDVEEIALIISIIMAAIVVLLLLFKACKCAMQCMKVVEVAEHNNDQNA